MPDKKKSKRIIGRSSANFRRRMIILIEAALELIRANAPAADIIWSCGREGCYCVLGRFDLRSHTGDVTKRNDALCAEPRGPHSDSALLSLSFLISPAHRGIKVSARVLIRFKARSWQSLQLLVAFCWENDERVVKIVVWGENLEKKVDQNAFFCASRISLVLRGFLFKHVYIWNWNLFSTIYV